jgi:deoxyribodipyrimidine photo-lyase
MLPKSDVPEIRVRLANAAHLRADGEFILYWMIANRRVRWNFGLQRAVDWARALRKPLVILEALRCDYRWASDRLHHFIVQGMADNAASVKSKPVLYYAYLEPRKDADKGLLAALAKRACVVVSDDFPCFFLPRMVEVAARQVPVRMELVDSNGILPMRAAEKVFARAVDFRRFLQMSLREHLVALPHSDPLRGVRLPRLESLPKAIVRRWPAANVAQLAKRPEELARLPLDHSVSIAETAGGSRAAECRMTKFLDEHLGSYAESRNEPDKDVASGLSPYLHFGHISAHEVFHALIKREVWSPAKLAAKANGSKEGWWGMSVAAESFLDELITWRELGYNMCWQRTNFDRFESLPNWAQKSLAKHARDRRAHSYDLASFELAETHDPLWNAAQRQLVREGKIHNYLRMLWGKKILEWSSTPQAALDTMIELNNKYALDGRNPNSYSGIFWVLGRYDRAWGPERPIFGKIRYMSSENTARKLRVARYLAKYAPSTDWRRPKSQ